MTESSEANTLKAGSAAAEPVPSRPLMPDGYGVPENDDTLMPWSWAVERLERERNYWFCTTRPDGRPHAMPAWAVWVDDALYFDGSPETRRGRNLAANPAIVVHLESGDEVVVLEGDVQEAGRPDRALAERLVAAFVTKYGQSHNYHPSPDQWDEGGLWVLHPSVAFGWDAFPGTVTRWRFRRRT
ncbi:MAG: pyridoxamine 5'-phosphate oxidase family protein [Chloroflexi bacterium]|nr:pyridoxamine 5'-phosphate oxidase family protein [Chloroflexota bacterium]